MHIIKNPVKFHVNGRIRKILVEAKPWWLNFLFRRMLLIIWTDDWRLEITATRKKEKIRFEAMPFPKEGGEKIDLREFPHFIGAPDRWHQPIMGNLDVKNPPKGGSGVPKK